MEGDHCGTPEVLMLRCPALAPQAGIIRWLHDQITFVQNYRVQWELTRQHMILKTHSARKEMIPAVNGSRFSKVFVLIFTSLKTTSHIHLPLTSVEQEAKLGAEV